MSPEDLATIEEALGIVLPADYRNVMSAYPFPADSPAAELWVLDDVNAVLELNRDYRRIGEGSWPAHLFLVGNDGSEEAYVLDTSVEPPPVRVYELETGKFRPYAASFSNFGQLQTGDLAEVEASERALSLEPRTRTSVGGNFGFARIRRRGVPPNQRMQPTSASWLSSVGRHPPLAGGGT